MGEIPTRHIIGNTNFPATLLGVGTAPLGNMFRPIEEKDVHMCLEAAWEGGVRYFDTAPFYGYGLAERRLGDFLRTKHREDYILSTKVGRLLQPRRKSIPTDTFFLSTMPFNPIYDYSYDAAMRSYEDSLQRMGLDRFDIVLIHDPAHAEHGEDQPEIFKQAMEGAAKALLKLRDEGEIGAIGLGTNEWEVAQAALEQVEFNTFLLAGRYTLIEQFAAKSFLPMCLEKNVNIILGGAFNSGLLVSDDIKNSTWNYKPAPQELIDKAINLKGICERHGVELPAAALQFAMAHPAVATVAVGVRNQTEMNESLKWSTKEIPHGLWTDLKDAGLLANDLPVPN